jgi:hypothetical protein
VKKKRAAKEPDGKDESLGQVMYPLILEALKDTTLWLSIDASAEEKVYIRRAHALLNELAGICERHRDSHAPPQKNKEWNPVATEVLSLVQKAANARQSIVGHGLHRLIELLAPPAKGEKQLPNEAKNRRNRVSAFMELVHQKTNQRIRKKDISLVAGYKDTTDFQRFQRNDPRTAASANNAFDRVLSMDPKDFVRLLEDKKHQTSKD